MSVRPESLASEFEKTFHRRPRLFHAPGRINLIGEHTDYNDGFVLPMALDRATWVAGAVRRDRSIVVRSEESGATVTIDLDRVPDRPGGRWSNYVLGVAAVLQRTARVSGADVLIRSDVPMGAGLSSSAALEVACGYALLALSGGPIDLTALARACQQAEHEFVGTRCGIMDQFVACHARHGSAMMLDTRSLEPTFLAMPDRVRVLACNTMVQHRLASDEYNARRADCEEALRVLATRFPGATALRDITIDQLESARNMLPDRVYRRSRHVIGENARVLDATGALAAGDPSRFGRLMRESHESLRDDYAVSCRELDVMVDVAIRTDGVFGARLTGGGFGGCVVALVDATAAEESRRRIQNGYEAVTRVRPDVWVCEAGAGVGEVTGEAE